MRVGIVWRAQYGNKKIAFKIPHTLDRMSVIHLNLLLVEACIFGGSQLIDKPPNTLW